MSTALGIAGVTATLQSMLNSVFNPGAGLGTVVISAVAPDVLQLAINAGNTPNQVNLFLHQVTLNTAWRNVDLPSLGPDGSTRMASPPMALDLHYLLTTYTAEDGFAEALLGFALLMLHQNPTLSRDQVRSALAALPASHPLFGPLQTTGLADQVELLKISPDTLGREEMAWIWTALKADYRPTFAFQVSVVLLQPAVTVTSPLPVVQRHVFVQAGLQPMLLQVQLPAGQAAVVAGDTVTITGRALGGALKIALTNQRFGFRYPNDLNPSAVSGTAVSFLVPDDAANLPAGVYTAAVLFNDISNHLVSTNGLPVAIAPVISAPASVTNTAAGTPVSVGVKPDVRPSQVISFAMGETAVNPQPFTANTGTLQFVFPPPGLPQGSYLARLQVDGVYSAVTVSGQPPAFTAPKVQVL